MNCAEIQDTGANAAFVRRFRKAVAAQNTPLNGTFALTHRCNLACSICYLAGASPHAMPGALARRLVAEMADAGCLSLVLTGGEPLLHPEFMQIYRHVRERGILATVFTNGTLIDDGLVRLFRDYPPRAIEVTLYGASAEIYETMTGVAGSYAACRLGLDRIAQAGLPLRLKTMVTTINRHEFSAMETLAQQYDARFRHDAALFPALDGNRGPLEFRVAPSEAVALDFSGPDRAGEWRDQVARADIDAPLTSLYACGAGRTGFHLEPEGVLKPCMMVRTIRVDACALGFKEAWRRVSRAISSRDAPKAGFSCRNCPRKIVCGYCPGFFEVEGGSETMPSAYICALGAQRWARLQNEMCA